MYQILPFVVAGEFALANLPVEIWAIILRCLDPCSLLTAARSIDLWERIIQGDLVLRKTLKKQLLLEQRRRREEMLNPGLLISIERRGSGGLFGSNVNKILHFQCPVRKPVDTQEKTKRRQYKDHVPLRKQMIQRTEQCKILRC
ncbi:hypothetical protein Zmor_015274 [Zophobas morio]|uniref:F-box domain-containing protein n=1 Tax=Zophobas morio TaxID=2755281 RepID=A0AA38IIY9_9CUCU|nr:hypothetical protein Zmor_015274 [Zophobas morio]